MTLRTIHDRIGSMIDQVGQPDYSLRELVEGLRDVRDQLLVLSETTLGTAQRGDDVPHRACRLSLSLEADTRAEMIFALEGIQQRIAREEMTRGCSGGYGSGFTYDYQEREHPTHDEYAEQLKRWKEANDAQR